jgi:hypothetical protein
MDWVEKLADWGWQAFLALVAAVIGWVFYVERRIAGLRLHVSETYVKRADMIELKRDINDRFDRLEDIILERGRRP